MYDGELQLRVPTPEYINSGGPECLERLARVQHAAILAIMERGNRKG
jgi:hypothetical protein